MTTDRNWSFLGPNWVKSSAGIEVRRINSVEVRYKGRTLDISIEAELGRPLAIYWAAAAKGLNLTQELEDDVRHDLIDAYRAMNVEVDVV